MTTQNTHEFFMEKALDQARQALDAGEFPVGCVIVNNNEIIADGQRTGTLGQGLASETDHAEILALRNLERVDPAPDPSQVTVYATMEPCLMCYGALLIRQVGTVVWAYEDAMGGGTSADLSRLPPLYRDTTTRVIPGVLRARSLALFKSFFQNPDNNYWKDSYLEKFTLAQEG